MRQWSVLDVSNFYAALYNATWCNRLQSHVMLCTALAFWKCAVLCFAVLCCAMTEEQMCIQNECALCSTRVLLHQEPRRNRLSHAPFSRCVELWPRLSRTITCDNKDGRWIGHLATLDDGKYKVPVRKSTQPMLVCFVVFLSEQAAPCVRQWDEG